MSFENEYKCFAVASPDFTEKAMDLADRVGLPIMVEAWLNLAEQTTQLVDHDADKAHSMMERPLKRASVQGH